MFFEKVCLWGSQVKKRKVMENEYLGTREGVNGYRFEKFSDLVGEILTLIEIAGLEKSQEKALKSKIKNLIWDMWDRPHFSWTEEELEDKECICTAEHEGKCESDRK